MTIIFLTDDQAEKLEIPAPSMKVKRYSLSPGSVVLDNEICTEREFIKRLGKTALTQLEEEG